MFWPIMRQVFRMWRDDDNYSHIILVPFLIGWQLHRRRDMFDPKARKTAPMVLLLLIPLAFFQFIAFVGDWWALQSVCLVAAIFGLITSLFLAVSGDSSAYTIAQKQPMKLASMEGLYKGQKANGLVLFGIPQPGKKPGDGKNSFLFKVEIPGLLSLMGYRNVDAFVPGVEDLLNGGF
ncbi:MAG: hypothetical protein CBB60_003725, partial [Armatimonadetes bacterium Cent15-Ar3]